MSTTADLRDLRALQALWDAEAEEQALAREDEWLRDAARSAECFTAYVLLALSALLLAVALVPR